MRVNYCDEKGGLMDTLGKQGVQSKVLRPVKGSLGSNCRLSGVHIYAGDFKSVHGNASQGQVQSDNCEQCFAPLLPISPISYASSAKVAHWATVSSGLRLC